VDYLARPMSTRRDLSPIRIHLPAILEEQAIIHPVLFPADLGFPMQVQRPQPWLPLTPSACIVGRIFKMDVSSVLGVGGVKGKKHEPSL
jgi:hypothetical protein